MSNRESLEYTSIGRCRLKKNAFFVSIAVILFVILITSSSEGQTPQAANKPKTLIAVIPTDAPPTYYKDVNTNEAAGFAVDVMNAIGKQAGYSITYQFKNDWVEVIDAVRTGEADVAPDLGITEERKKVLSFTVPTSAVPVSIFVRENSGIAGLSDGMNVGVVEGSAAYEEMRTRHGKILLVTYESFQSGLYDLLAGQIDAFVCPAPTLLKLARNADIESRIKIVGPPLMELKRAIAVRQDNKELLARLNAAVDDFVRTAAYQQLYTKWYGQPRPYWAVDRRVVFYTGYLLIIIVIMAGWRHYSIISLNKTLVKTKEQLKQSEKFSNTIIETEPECVKILDADGNLIFMNRAGLDMIQAESLEQVKGQCVCPLITSEYCDAFMKLTKDVCNGGSGTLAFEMIGLKGRRLWLETHAVPFRNEKDEITALLGITRDITEKKKAEADLKKSEENFRTLFNKSADALFLIRLDGSIADVNDVVSQRYQYTREELLAMNVAQIDSPATGKYAAERIEKIRRHGTAFFEVEHITKDGLLIPVEVSASLIMWGDETLLLCSCRDITERKKAAEAIAAEKERLAVTLRSIGDGVIVTDVDGNITLLNKVGEQLTGWSTGEARRRPLADVFNILNENTGEKSENPVEKALKTGMVVGLADHTILKRRDGTAIIIDDSAAPILDAQSNIIGSVLVFRDTTAQCQMEDEMQRMEKFESLGLLAGGIAHDFNNLLTAILGNVSLAKMHLEAGHKSFDKLSDAENAAKRATELTYQLLTFAKGGAPIKKPASLSEIVKETCLFAMSGSNVKCRFAIPPSLWSADVDKGQMSQVFNNLLINAIHAMPNGGTVHIGYENVTLRDNQVATLTKGDYVKITFRDEGIGIPEQNLPKIFDPYYTTKALGSGLGLATVTSIINRHGGHITAESKIGVGTTFTLFIPALKDTIAPVSEEVKGARTGHGRVLIMDDEAMIRNVAGAILNALGYEVALANDGQEAVELYLKAKSEQNPFDVVIMDLTVPGGMGGKEAVRNLRAVVPDAKVIVSSGYSMDPIMAEYEKYGFCGVVSKPYNALAISEELSRVMKLKGDH